VLRVRHLLTRKGGLQIGHGFLRAFRVGLLGGVGFRFLLGNAPLRSTVWSAFASMRR